MNRRKAALILASIIAAMAGKTKAEDQPPEWTTTGKTSFVGPAPLSISFDLEGFKDYTFHFKGTTLTFTPEELFKALSEQP